MNERILTRVTSKSEYSQRKTSNQTALDFPAISFIIEIKWRAVSILLLQSQHRMIHRMTLHMLHKMYKKH